MKDNNESQLQLSGLSMAPGLGAGSAFIYRDILHRERENYDIDESDVESEHKRLSAAIDEAASDLDKVALRVSDQLDESLGDVFLAQKAMLQDDSFLADVRRQIEEHLVIAERAVQHVIAKWHRRFAAMENDMLSQKKDDVADFGRRLLRRLEGSQAHQLERLPDDRILIARRLLPSDTVFLSRKSVRGIVLELGGTASHTAILAREMGVPCVGRVDNALKHIRADDCVLIDGKTGNIAVRPPETEKKRFAMRIEADRQEHLRQRCNAAKRAVTLSGIEIGVHANASCPDDIRAAHEEGADGIGLYRTEGLYLGREEPPTEDEIFNVLFEALKPMCDKPIVLRFLDIGADKNVPFFTPDTSLNPALGRQGVRVLLKYPDLLKPQMRAFLRLSEDYDIRLLVPMITHVDEMEAVRTVMQTEAKDLGMQELPKLGAMVETPAAALVTKALCEHSEFLSIGTNDLTQYTMVADRENPRVDDYFNEDHPAVMRLIEMVAREAEESPVSICGEAAGRLDLLATFLKTGIRALSVAPSRAAEVKSHIRELP